MYLADFFKMILYLVIFNVIASSTAAVIKINLESKTMCENAKKQNIEHVLEEGYIIDKCIIKGIK